MSARRWVRTIGRQKQQRHWHIDLKLNSINLNCDLCKPNILHVFFATQSQLDYNNLKLDQSNSKLNFRPLVTLLTIFSSIPAVCTSNHQCQTLNFQPPNPLTSPELLAEPQAWVSNIPGRAAMHGPACQQRCYKFPVDAGPRHCFVTGTQCAAVRYSEATA